MSDIVKTLDSQTLVRPTNLFVFRGDLYISDEADWNSWRIYKRTPGGFLLNDCSQDRLMNIACRYLNSLYGITAIKDKLYIADALNNKLFSINEGGLHTHIAGYQPGYANGFSFDASFDHPNGITAIGDTFYVADTYNNRIRKIGPDGAVTTFAGSKPGYADGIGTDAKFSNPHGITAVGRDLYVTDSSNHRIRKISPNGTVSTVAGSERGFEDGIATDAKFNFPTRITALDDILYIVDLVNRCIRTIDVGRKPSQENRLRKKGMLVELQTLPSMGIFPGGINFQEGEKRWQLEQTIRKKRTNRKTKTRRRMRNERNI